jgi:hypothetical protein
VPKRYLEQVGDAGAAIGITPLFDFPVSYEEMRLNE